MTDELTPDAAREEIAAMRADADHPLNDSGHFKHLDAVDRLQSLLDTIGQTPAETRNEAGEHTTANLEKIMAPALEPVGSPEGYSFDAYKVPEGAEWDAEQEAMFRQVFHNAQLSQGEADQLQAIASSNVPVDVDRAEVILQSRYRGDPDTMQRDIAAARAAVRRVGGQPLVDWLNETGLGDSIQFFDMALRKAKQMGIEV
jgi:hypothetical protein